MKICNLLTHLVVFHVFSYLQFNHLITKWHNAQKYTVYYVGWLIKYLYYKYNEIFNTMRSHLSYRHKPFIQVIFIDLLNMDAYLRCIGFFFVIAVKSGILH